MAAVSMKDLLETGVHFGHRTRRWNPKMRPYIFTERNGIHILDLQQTLKALSYAVDMVRDMVAEGGTIMFVGTKRQAQETIMTQADRCSMPYVNQRWLGGTLTNWRTIRQRIDHLKGLEGRRERGEFELLTKKEALMLTREIDKLTMRLSGIREMNRVPDMLFVVDVQREHTAIREANILDIPILGVVDTNCDPDLIDYVIPANDDAIRAIKLMATAIADAVLEGVGLRKDVEIEEVAEDVDLEAMAEGTDETLLGEATLAKLREARLFDEKEGEEDESADDDDAADDESTEDEAAEEDAGEETADDDDATQDVASEEDAGEEETADDDAADEDDSEDEEEDQDEDE